MQLYNTLGRQLQDFKPQEPSEVTLYTCGPTVYDFAHIGNLRAFVFDDTLRRTLEASGLTVRHVMNITDVGHLVADEDESVLSEDKFEKGARREGKTVWDVAEHYTEAFKKDMTALNILPPNIDPKREKNRAAHDSYARATDFIPEQIEMVKALLKNGFAYPTKQAIYFDITKLKDYGKLTGQNLTDKEVAVRPEVVTDPDKLHPHDFAVWFFTVGHFAEHTMRWPSPWGEGFPGWHLECSAIIHATLGDPIDIHTGGVDHIGTHHTNEIAQTEGAFNHELAHIWMHNEHLLVDSGKMSKSKRNFYTLKDITDHGFHPLALRLLFLQAHYRSELNFTWESLKAAQNRLLNIYAWADLKHQSNLQTKIVNVQPYDEMAGGIIRELRGDLSTPSALNFLALYIDDITSQGHDPRYLQRLLNSLDATLGLRLADRPDITKEQKALIEKRQQLRQKAKHENSDTEAKELWAKAGDIRDELRDKHHLEIDDTPAGPRWRRTKI